jgi:hypothetical protein
MMAGIGKKLDIKMLDTEEEDEDEETTAMDAQQGHTASIARMHYAIDSNQLGTLDEFMLCKYRHVSSRVHREVFGIYEKTSTSPDPDLDPTKISTNLRKISDSLEDSIVLKVQSTLERLLPKLEQQATRLVVQGLNEALDLQRARRIADSRLPDLGTQSVRETQPVPDTESDMEDHDGEWISRVENVIPNPEEDTSLVDGRAILLCMFRLIENIYQI